MSRSKTDLHPDLVFIYEQAEAEFKRLYPELPQPFITCTHRSVQEQNDLYAIGRTLPGKRVTNAKGGQSPHNFMPSLAYDIAFIGLDKKTKWDGYLFDKFAACYKSAKVMWGGNFQSLPDKPHTELKDWKTIAGLIK